MNKSCDDNNGRDILDLEEERIKSSFSLVSE
jgi:hypothetical protein